MAIFKKRERENTGCFAFGLHEWLNIWSGLFIIIIFNFCNANNSLLLFALFPSILYVLRVSLPLSLSLIFLSLSLCVFGLMYISLATWTFSREEKNVYYILK